MTWEERAKEDYAFKHPISGDVDITERYTDPDTGMYISAIRKTYRSKKFDNLRDVLERPNNTRNIMYDFRPTMNAYNDLISLNDVPEDIKRKLQTRVNGPSIGDVK